MATEFNKDGTEKLPPTFLDLGFTNTVTESSIQAKTDGYVGTLNGLPFHIHPTATPDEFKLLETGIKDGLVIINAFTPPPGPSAEQIRREQIGAARSALNASDNTMIRCLVAGVEIPQEWNDYRALLREVITSGGTLPERPAYPEGT